MSGIAPLCFVLMPWGTKPDPLRAGAQVDWDRLYEAAIRPGIEDAGLRPIRSDEPVFERLVLCDDLVAELTSLDASLLYELGIRHALRPNSTQVIFADHGKPALDVAMLRALPYALGPGSEVTDELAGRLRKALTARLRRDRDDSRTTGAADRPIEQLVAASQQSGLPVEARLTRLRKTDGALFELLDHYGRHDKTDVFREAVGYDGERRRQLAEARAAGSGQAIARLAAVQKELEPLDEAEAGVIVDLYLSYRAVNAWREMIALSDAMPAVLGRTVLVREQRAFALNRLAGKAADQRHLRDQAIEILDEVLAETGPNPETCGLLGRIYKDRWQEALAAGNAAEAADQLRRGINAYVAGFEADWRDAYPGVNAVTLLDIEGSEDSLKKKRELLPAVHFAVARRVAAGNADYWDWATLLELSVLADRPEEAADHVAQALAAVRETWEPETTAKNLGFIRDARAGRGDDVAWIDRIIGDLRARAGC